jgi:hypothetical protein
MSGFEFYEVDGLTIKFALSSDPQSAQGLFPDESKLK